MEKSNVFIVCTGVGHINRGYESFTKECFVALKDNDYFNLYLLKGGGQSADKELKINCVQRNSSRAVFLSKIFKKETYWIEEFTFFIGMIPEIIKYKPAVIYYSDFILGTFLFHLKRFFKFKYKLLFSNGAPNGPPFKTEDHVQQLLPVYMDNAIKAGASASMQTLLPYGFDINVGGRLNNIHRAKELRSVLCLPEEKKIILSVGAINKYHKRMDYIIEEVSKLPDNYFLVLLGQFEDETAELLNLANKKLPFRHIVLSVPAEKVKDYYIASDYFVLASLIEGFGRVLIEALSYGLPCIVNDYINAKQVLGKYGAYIDMEKDGALSDFIINDRVSVNKEELIEATYDNYSWEKLKHNYINMIYKLYNRCFL